MMLLLGACALGAAARASAFTLIDDFTSGGVTLSVNPGHTLDSGIETGSMIGGSRFNYLLIIQNPAGAIGSAAYSPAVPALTVTQGAQLTTECFNRYGGSGQPDLNANLTGEDRLRVVVRSNDLAIQANAFMTTIDSSNGFHTVQQSLTIAAGSSPHNADFLFAGFGADSGFQLGNVDQISFQFNASGNYSLGSFSAVPEPSTVLLLLFGASAVALARVRAIL